MPPINLPFPRRQFLTPGWNPDAPDYRDLLARPSDIAQMPGDLLARPGDEIYAVPLAQNPASQRPPLVLAPAPEPEIPAPLSTEPTPYPIRPASRQTSMGIPVGPELPTPTNPTPLRPAPVALPDIGPLPNRPLPPSLSPVPPETPDALAALNARQNQNMSEAYSGDRRGVPIPVLPGRVGQPTPDDPLARANYDYAMKNAKRDAAGNLIPMDQGGGIKRSWKDILLSALVGGLQGAGATGSWQGAVGGAAMGAGAAGVNPLMGREYLFNTFHAPRIAADMQRQQEMEARRRQTELDDLRMKDARRKDTLGDRELEDYPEDLKLRQAERQARIDELKARAQERLRPKPPTATAWEVDADGFYRDRATGRLILDPQTQQPVRAPEKAIRATSSTEAMKQAELDRIEEEGDIESIAEDYYQGRGGDEYVISKLPPQTQQILRDGTVNTVMNGATYTDSATPAQVAQAATMRDKAIADERRRIKAEVEGNAKRKNAARVREQGGATQRPTRPTGNAPSASISAPAPGSKGSVGPGAIQKVASRLNISPEEARRRIEADGYTIVE